MTPPDQEMLNDLVVESREHLSSIEPDLLSLEQQGDATNGEIINRVFRAVHSIKGGFGFFGIERVVKLAHTMENVMSKIRDKELSVSPAVTDALLKGVDKLRILLDDVGNAGEVSIDEELKGLTPFLEKEGCAPTSPTAKPSSKKSESITAVAEPVTDPAETENDAFILSRHPRVTDSHISDALKNGKLLYEITVNSVTDCSAKGITPAALFGQWETLGDLLDVTPDYRTVSGDRDSEGNEIKYQAVFSTVMEADLVSVGTGIPDEQIFSFDMKAIRPASMDSTPSPQPPSAQGGSPASGPSVAATKKPSSEKALKNEPKIEDALRVKVGLLNNLMNLAGELVLSRNQLMQSVNRRLSDALELQELPGESLRKGGDRCAATLSARLIDIPGINNIIQNIDMVTSLLQESIMQTRLQPISVVFAKFPRLVRDLAKKLDKEITLTLIGQEVELDKSIIEQLGDPLTHLIRNSVDHGIESKADRAKAGKTAQGEIVLRAFHESGKVHIQISDNGAGLNRERIRQKALSNGLFTAEELSAMSEHEIDNIIMLPGFSTAAKVSDVSGRGVGMDVVKTNIESLGGTVEIESVEGLGSVITMKLPLTLAIISSLIVSAGGRRFAIPQVGIEELVRVRSQDVTNKISRLKECEVMRLRGKLLPLVRLADAVGMEAPRYFDPETETWREDKRNRWSDRRGMTPSDAVSQAVADKVVPADAASKTASASAAGQAARGGDRRGLDRNGPDRRGPDRRASLANAVKIIVLKYGERRFGLVVDEVFDAEEIVVKPLSGYLKSCQVYAGSTIMGDGTVAMILDTNGMAAKTGLKFESLEKDIEAEKERYLKESTRSFRELLLFSTGGNGNFGVDLATIARVEKVETTRISSIGGREYLKYDDRSLRLVRLSDHLPIEPSADSNGHTFVIVPKETKHPMGIVADAVKDVIRTDATLDTANIRGTGIMGSVILDGTLTMVIDVEPIFKAAEPEIFA